MTLTFELFFYFRKINWNLDWPHNQFTS